MLTALGAALHDRNDGLQEYRGVSDQSELPFMCLQCGMEEAAKHPVLDGKFVKVACVHKSVPGLSSSRRVVRLSAIYQCGRFCSRYGHP
jgi:hypothetical protein